MLSGPAESMKKFVKALHQCQHCSPQQVHILSWASFTEVSEAGKASSVFMKPNVETPQLN
jgi:hypothetical protein